MDKIPTFPNKALIVKQLHDRFVENPVTWLQYGNSNVAAAKPVSTVHIHLTTVAALIIIGTIEVLFSFIIWSISSSSFQKECT